MPQRFTIREGLWDGDIQRISALLRETTLSPDAALVGMEGEEYFRTKYDPKRVKEWYADIVLTAWSGDDFAGFGRARKDGFITHIVVHREYRNLGLGSRILGILEETLGSAGNGTLFLDADPDTIGFYRRNGWVRRESSPLDGRGLMLVSMEKELY